MPGTELYSVAQDTSCDQPMNADELIRLLDVTAHLVAALGWPTVASGVIFVFRHEIKQLLKNVKRVEIFGQKAEVLEVKEEIGKEGARLASVAVQTENTVLPAELTQFQRSILKEFLERGDYDTLTISNAAFPDFSKLKTLNLIRWEKEEPAKDVVSVTKFGLTDKGKQLIQ